MKALSRFAREHKALHSQELCCLPSIREDRTDYLAQFSVFTPKVVSVAPLLYVIPGSVAKRFVNSVAKVLPLLPVAYGMPRKEPFVPFAS